MWPVWGLQHHPRRRREIICLVSLNSRIIDELACPITSLGSPFAFGVATIRNATPCLRFARAVFVANAIVGPLADSALVAHKWPPPGGVIKRQSDTAREAHRQLQARRLHRSSEPRVTHQGTRPITCPKSNAAERLSRCSVCGSTSRWHDSFYPLPRADAPISTFSDGGYQKAIQLGSAIKGLARATV